MTERVCSQIGSRHISAFSDSRHPDRSSGCSFARLAVARRGGKRVTVGEDQRAKRGAEDTGAD